MQSITGIELHLSEDGEHDHEVDFDFDPACVECREEQQLSDADYQDYMESLAD